MSAAMECGGKAAAFKSGGAATALQNASLPLALAALALLAATIDGSLLELQRGGPWWRIVTCHFTHWSYEQLAWDAIACTALGVACARRNGAAFHATLLASIVLIPIAVTALAPDITAYRGLSGIASAFFALLLTTQDRLSWPLALSSAGFVAKLGFEATSGSAVFVSSMGTGVVAVPVAHLAGALIGLVAGWHLYTHRPCASS